MKTLAPASRLEEIQRAAKAVQTPFPYAECRALARNTGTDYQSLVSDLDTYFYDVWSPANGAGRLPQKPEAWLCDLQKDLTLSFFERYPQYAALEKAINSEDAPLLSRRLADFDMLRRMLRAYLSERL